MSRRSSFSESDSDSDEEIIRLLQREMAARQPVRRVRETPQPVRRVRETPQRESPAQLRVWDDVSDLFDMSREVPMPQLDMLVAYGKWLRSHTVFTSIQRKEESNQRLTRKERLFKFSSLCALWVIDGLPEFESLTGLLPNVASSDYELMKLYERRWKVFKEAYLALFLFVKFTDEERDLLADIRPLVDFSSRFEIFFDGYERFQAKVPIHGVPELPEDFTF